MVVPSVATIDSVTNALKIALSARKHCRTVAGDPASKAFGTPLAVVALQNLNLQPTRGKVMATLGTIISWAVFGLIVGLIARFLYPGRQPMSLLMTMLLGVAGSLLGGFISWGVGFHPEDGPFRGAGWIMSIAGSILVVWIGLFAASKSSPGKRST